MHLKNTVVATLASLMFFVASSVSAAQSFSKGQVEFVRTHDGAGLSGLGWAPPNFWFTLKNVSSAGACRTWNGAVLFVARDRQALAVILAAQTAGLEVSVYWDDTQLTNGWCTAQYMTTGNPAPLY